MFNAGDRIRLPGEAAFVTVDDALVTAEGFRVYIAHPPGSLKRVDLSREDAAQVTFLREDGGAAPARVLAGLWSGWMRASVFDARATALATTPLRPYTHQNNAVYGAMLPQPRMRFLLADEPGTGKTIMAGLYLREMQRLGFVGRCLIVAPAHLVPKWQADFERFFGGGLSRVTAGTAQEATLRPDLDLWIVSLDLAAVNPRVQELIHPRNAGWDLVVFDEAHRLTPTAQNYYRVGRALAYDVPRALLMTATPHRGKEWLFRALMHLVDPKVFPEVAGPDEVGLGRLKPGALHYLRRMKENLVDYDNITPLFHRRRATNVAVSLNTLELGFYQEALEMVTQFFPREAVPLASMVYGKRAASTLHALAETLRRRRDRMGTETPAFAAESSDPDWEDTATRDEAKVIVEASRAAAAEKKAIAGLLERLESQLQSPDMPVSKWPRMVTQCLTGNGINPEGSQQAVLFTEYADSADWLVRRFRQEGYTAERYSGRDPGPAREDVRRRFAAREFQILVSTDAGNEGIDLQTAHVLVNWDIPWSLVRLEQRMGRIHRIGQTRDVELYNLVATQTREGEVLTVLLDNFVTAANALRGKVFDSLSLVAELVGLDAGQLLSETYQDDPRRLEAALEAARAVTANQLQATAERVAAEENNLATNVDVAAAVAALQDESLERINPRIVEAYLSRVGGGGVLGVRRHAADGVFELSRGSLAELPRTIGGGSRTLVATSASALAAARSTGADVNAVPIGPSEAGFRDLVRAVLEETRHDLFRGSVLADATSVTDYDLLLYEADVLASGGKRKTVWPLLIRADGIGARLVSWEMLANLEPVEAQRTGLHPARATDADEWAREVALERKGSHEGALRDWLREVSVELRRLPMSLSAGISDAATRRSTRAALSDAVREQLSDLEKMAQIQVRQVERIGWCHVVARGLPPDPTESDSEAISTALVSSLLRDDGWAVADVRTERRGYDLRAIRGRSQRCVEVKGIWESASTHGVRMTGDEVLIARQQGGDYWLYVIDRCADGGRVFGVFPDPATLFEMAMRDVSIVAIPGSALAAARVGSDHA